MLFKTNTDSFLKTKSFNFENIISKIFFLSDKCSRDKIRRKADK